MPESRAGRFGDAGRTRVRLLTTMTGTLDPGTLIVLSGIAQQDRALWLLPVVACRWMQ
ncbi:MAG TPA: hypothetical protein VGA56_17375 [Opitutaceae bacterium]